MLGEDEMSKLHTRVVGTGPSRVVFLHGLFGQGRNFTKIAHSLGEVATSLLVDLPNHGRSAWTERFDYGEMADDVADAIRSWNPVGEPVVVVGHSMGGKVAMRLTLDHPELVAKLCVVDISPVDTKASTHFESLVDAMRSIDTTTLRNRREADAAIKTKVPDASVRSFLLQNLSHSDDGWRWRHNLELLGDNLAAVGDWPTQTSHWSGPTLWVAGASSDYVQRRNLPVMRALFPGVRMVRIAGASHWVHSDQPEEFIATLRAFINRR